MAGKKLKLELSLSALKDLEGILKYYAQQGTPETGRRLAKEILKKAERLSQFPESGRLVPEFASPFLREIIYPPFRIVYRREGSKVSLVRVWRSERLME